jgi:broad specificity phosphatase PhoE
MSKPLPVVYLARHGETAWSISGQHTGLTDLPLTDRGERNARRLADRLKGLSFKGTEFQQGVHQPFAACDEDLRASGIWRPSRNPSGPARMELRRIRTPSHRRNPCRAPDWQLFRDGCPGGETPDRVGARADRVVKRVHEIQGNVLIFSSGHILRVLSARWLGLEPAGGKDFLLSTASLSALGYEHNLSQPIIQLWNDTNHVGS